MDCRQATQDRHPLSGEVDGYTPTDHGALQAPARRQTGIRQDQLLDGLQEDQDRNGGVRHQEVHFNALRETYRIFFLFESQYVTGLSSGIGNDLGTTLVPHSYPFCFALKERYRGAKVTTTLHIQQLFVLKFA